MTKLFQYHAGNHPLDAITNAMLLLAERLAHVGLAGSVGTWNVHRDLSGRLERFSADALGPDDVLLIHHSADNPVIDEVVSAKCRKILVYHNITKPAFFGPGDEVVRRSVVEGYAQLARLRGVVDGAVCDSAFNARALVERGFSDVEPICLLADFEGLPDRPHRARPYRHRDDVFHVLFVGRICRNKGQHDLIRAVPAIERAVGRRVRLTLCGHADHGRDHLRALRDDTARLGLGDRVAVDGAVPNEELYGLYRDADAYVSYSRHEGFGVPLVEAMAFGVPVFALRAAAVAETLGGAGRLLESPDPEELAAAIAEVFRTRSGLRGLVRRQRARAAELSIDRSLPKLLAFLDRRYGLSLSAALAPTPAPSGRRQVLVEGPAEPAGTPAGFDDAFARALRAIDATPVRAADRVDEPDAAPVSGTPAPLSIAAPSVGFRDAAAPTARGQLADLRLQRLACGGSRLPSWLVRQVNAGLDGVLVSGRHGVKVCRDSGVRVPVAVIGDGSAAPAPLAATPRARGEGPFVFLLVASGHPDEETHAVLKAYVSAFAATDDVVLAVAAGTDPSTGVQAVVDRIRAGPDAPRVVVDGAEPTPARLAALCGAADAVVPPTAGPVVEAVAAAAVAAGRPVIAPAIGARFDTGLGRRAIRVRSRFVASGDPDAEPGSHRVAFDRLDLARVLRAVASGRAPGPAEPERERGEGEMPCEDVAALVDRLEAPRPTKERIRLAAIARYDDGPSGDVAAIARALPAGPYEVEHWGARDAAEAAPGTVRRLWSPRAGDFESLCRRAVDERFDAVLVGHDPAAFAADDFVRGLAHLRVHRIVVHVVLDEAPEDGADAREAFLRDHAAELAAVDGVFVHTLADLNRLAEHGLHDRVTLLPRVVPDLPVLAPDGLRHVLGLAADGPIVLSVGPPPPDLIGAFALSRGRFPRARLVLAASAGAGADARRLDATCREPIALHGLADRVVAVDAPLTVEQVHILAAASDLVVVPGGGSRAETGAAIRRALAARRPVLAVGADLAEDVIPVVARAERGDPEGLAEAMLAILGSEPRLAEVDARAEAFVRGRTAQDVAEIVVGAVEQAVMHRDGVERPLFTLAAGPPPVARASETVLGRRRGRDLLAGLLGRAPTDAEVAGIDRALATGVPLARAVDELIASDEYFEAVHANPRLLAALALPGVDLAELRRLDGRAFVEACYREILGRAGDEGGIAQFMRAFERAAPDDAKRIVVDVMTASPEYRDAVVPRIVVDSQAGDGS